MSIKKEDFQVYDKHLGNDGGAYKKLGKGTWYNDEMYQEALKQGQTLPIDSVSECRHPSLMYINSELQFLCLKCKTFNHKGDRR